MPTKLTLKQLADARLETPLFMANIASKSKLKLATPLAFFEKNFNTDYEELGCIGYNPNSQELTAIIKIKRSSGYNGSLCTKGSVEYVRFYVNYGSGYKDEGVVGVNVHDIPDTNDCEQKVEKPLEFAVRLKIDPKNQDCSKPFLPKVKAVLLWQTVPPANDPDLLQPGYVWGNVKEAQIQIKPVKVVSLNPNLSAVLQNVLLNPNISLSNMMLNNPLLKKNIMATKSAIIGEKIGFSDLVKQYSVSKAQVLPERLGFKFLAEAISTKNVDVIKNSQLVFAENQLDYTKALNALIASKGNVSYEELGCVGLDYHNEALVATFTAKRNYGYGGNLCSAGSKEYVTFWMRDESTNCQWQKLGTQIVELHDIPNHTGLSYSAILPYDFSKFKMPCGTPRNIKIRAVLSWNVEPTELDTPYWGNFKEAYIQLAPKNWIGTNPKMIMVGGVAVDNIHATSGLTLPGAKFEINQNPVPDGSRFMGKLSIHGISAPYAGMKYRIKVINLENSSSYYVTDPLFVVGYDSANNIVHTVVNPDAAHFYTYQPYNLNILSQLALFSPGTSARIMIVIEHENGTTDSRIVQMDNTSPAVTLNINDSVDCIMFKKGETIKGTFTAIDNFPHVITMGGYNGKYTKIQVNSGMPLSVPAGIDSHVITNTNVTQGDFEFKTATDKNCGFIVVSMAHKTVVDSAYLAPPVHVRRDFCLRD